MDAYGRGRGYRGGRGGSGSGGRGRGDRSGGGRNDGGSGYGRGRNDGGHQRQYQQQHHRQYEQQHQQHQYRRSDQQWRVSSESEIQAPPTEVGSGLGHVGSSSTSGYSEGSTSRRGGYDNRGRGRNWVQTPRPSSEPVHDDVVQAIQLLRVSKQMSPLCPDNENKVLPVKRPDDGGKSTIRQAKIFVNHFPVKYNSESIIWHYDVDIKLEEQPKHGHPSKIHKSKLRMIRDKLFSDDYRQFPLSKIAYDGEKNIFSAIQLPCGLFKVEYSEGEDVNPRSYLVEINFVNELKLAKLEDYLHGNLFACPRDVLHGLDVVMKENPVRQMISVGRSFYPTEFRPEDHLGWGLITSTGFQHSLKLTNQGLVLCLDYSVLPFRKPIPVIEFLEEHIEGFNINFFGNFWGIVVEVLRGLKVTVTHRITKQKFTIMGLTDKITKYIDFPYVDPEGKASPKQVSLVDYFLDKYHKNITYKDIPCLNLGKNKINYVPMEFCVLVEGQRYPKEYLDKPTAKMLKNRSLAPPQERKNRICNMVRSDIGPCGGEVIQNFGLEVYTNMTELIGRVIEPPELKLGDRNGRINKITVDNEKCQWNLVGKSVVEGRTIERWAMIDFSAYERFNRLNPNSFIPKLQTRCSNLGIYMEEPLIYESARMNVLSDSSRLRKLLETVNERGCSNGGGRLQIIVCVMAKRDPGYKFLKWMSETRIGIVTQCCLSEPANKATDQYLANLALKINAKLGGSNVELNDKLPNFGGEGNVMFIGADVNYPGPGNTTSPSIAAVVATVNWPAANRYAARVRAQDPRSEKILNFGEMCLELVETYARVNKVRPEKIVVFRDGVSEGQFDMVLNEELVDIKRAIQSGNYSPIITLIVAQKRHRTRLFQAPRDKGLVGNVSPGTVVDTKIVHPFEFDFYLCSHYGSLGTSKPTHYHVLWDEHNFGSDQLQKLIYNLCFTFARCSKPVSLVPPVYYADLAAYRGRLYYEALTEGQSPGSVASSSSSHTSSSLSATSIDEQFKLHGDIENIMFFV